MERKAAEAHETGKQAIAAWREAQTKQLLDTFKAKMQDGDFASLPLFRQAISSIGTAQHELRLVRHMPVCRPLVGYLPCPRYMATAC